MVETLFFTTNNMETLTPVNGKKSFYGKCKMINEGEITKLQSYSTIVAEYNNTTGIMIIHDWYSMTTATHINAFLDYFGFETTNKKGMQEWEPQTAIKGSKNDH